MGLFKRKNSPYYFMKFQLNGRCIYESTKTSNKKLAEEIYLNRRHEIINGIEPQIKQEPQKQITFSELADKYLEYTAGRLKSHKGLFTFYKKLNGYFGNRTLTAIKVEDVENMQSDILKQGLSNAYANRLLIHFKRALKKAADWEIIPDNVINKFKRVKLLKGEVKRLRYLSEEEAERLIECCEPTYLLPIVITALNTGMRKSEILKLTWDKVDLKNRLILLDKTKNGERREIPINRTLYNTLSGLIRDIRTDYVFYNSDTLKPFCDIKKSFGRALKKAHILNFRFHDLRHTFASRLVMAGVDLTTLKELLGHKDIKMTLRYSHLAASHISNAVNILDDCCKIVAVDNKEKNVNI